MRSLLILPLCLAPLGCGGPAPKTEATSAAPLPQPLPWTEAFAEPCVLIADSVRIEGPAGLREHVAQHQDPEFAEYSIETTVDGLLQITEARVGGLAPGDFRELRLQLDGWSIVALRRIEVLERPTEVPVSIVATGGASFTHVASGERRNGPRLEFRGERPAGPE